MKLIRSMLRKTLTGADTSGTKERKQFKKYLWDSLRNTREQCNGFIEILKRKVCLFVEEERTKDKRIKVSMNLLQGEENKLETEILLDFEGSLSPLTYLKLREIQANSGTIIIRTSFALKPGKTFEEIDFEGNEMKSFNPGKGLIKIVISMNEKRMGFGELNIATDEYLDYIRAIIKILEAIKIEQKPQPWTWALVHRVYGICKEMQ